MKKSARRLATRILCASLLLAPVGAAIADMVIVRPGDTLALIAERELGNRSRYSEICELNLRALRHDCDYLVAGMELTLPERGAGARNVVASRPSAMVASRGPSNTIQLKGDYVVRLGGSSDEKLTAPKGYKATLTDDYVELKGHVANASAGGRPGIWLRIPDSMEERASGKIVVVKAVVRMRRTPGPIAMAYSTADVGNSGWVTKGAGTDFKSVSFTYRVPAMKKGGGDYVGILPDPRNAGQVLQVAQLAVSVLGE